MPELVGRDRTRLTGWGVARECRLGAAARTDPLTMKIMAAGLSGEDSRTPEQMHANRIKTIASVSKKNTAFTTISIDAALAS